MNEVTMTVMEKNEKALDAPRHIYAFGENSPCPPLNKEFLGTKGLGLAEMAAIGIPVPPGFIISTAVYQEYKRLGNVLTTSLQKEILNSIALLEKQTAAHFGCEKKPLLISVRPSVRMAMPGMMETILNLGLNDQSVEGFAQESGDERLAYDNYRRFIMMYGEIVGHIDRQRFEMIFHTLKNQEGAELDIDLSIDGLKESCSQFKKIYETECRHPFPQDAHHQLFEAIKAVFHHWDSERCCRYRQLHRFLDSWGTAVTVQAMVFGNKNDRSAAGVGFTRNPSNGERGLCGEFLLNAQGEDLKAGIRQAHAIGKRQKEATGSYLKSLEEIMPEAYQRLLEIAEQLENYYKEIQEIEFTIDDGKLYLLETHSANKTALATLRTAVDMLEEGLIDEKSALKKINPAQLAQLLAPIFSPSAKEVAKNRLAAIGSNAGGGALSGKLVFSPEKAIELKTAGMTTILVRDESSTEDLAALATADGILTLHGGSNCPTAINARSMDKPHVIGCGDLHLNQTAKTLSVGSLTLHEEDAISIDGNSGEVYFCAVETCASEIVQVLMTGEKKAEESLLYRQYKKVMELAEKYARSH